jgi:hypothetical protein
VDKQIIVLLIPILALCIPVSAIVLHGLQKLARLRVEEARVRSGAADQGSEAELTALRQEVAELRADLTEVHERLDFTERVLSQSRDTERVQDRLHP